MTKVIQPVELKFQAKLIDGYISEMKFLSRGRVPTKFVSNDRVLEINILLKDVQALFVGKHGARYLNLISPELPVSPAEVILALKPYQVLLMKTEN